MNYLGYGKRWALRLCCGCLRGLRRADWQGSEEETQHKGVGSHRGCGICGRDSGGYSDRPNADAALIGRSVCRKRMRLGKEFTKQIGICGGMNIWQMRITNLARNLTFAMS